MSCQLWHLVGGVPTLLGTRDDKAAVEKLRRMEAGNEPTAIGMGGVVLGAMHATPKQLEAFRAAVKTAHLAGGGAPPAPLPVPTEAPTHSRANGLRFGKGTPLEDEDDAVEAVAVAPVPKPGRPATRPPLARRRVTSVAGGTLTAPPIEAPAPAPQADTSASKVAQLQRLLSQVTSERDAYRDRIESAEHRVEQLRGEVEGLTTDLGVARRELAVTVAQLNDLSDSTKTELATRRDENAQLRAAPAAALVPAQVLLDELMLERIALRAARRAVALQGDATKLDRLCREHGGADAVARIVEGAIALRRAVG